MMMLSTVLTYPCHSSSCHALGARLFVISLAEYLRLLFSCYFSFFWIWKNISILQVPENIWRSWCKPGLPDWSTFILCRFILVDEFALKWKRITLCSALSAVLYRFPLRFMLESCEIKALDRWVNFLIYKVKVKSASRTLSLTVFAVVR